VRIRKAALTPVIVAILCWSLFLSAGCNSGTSSNYGGEIPAQATALTRVDWGRPLLAGGTVGTGQYPAKFTFDANAAPDCTNDFVAYNTGIAGAAATAAASGTFSFSGQPAAGQTITFISPESSVIITASNSSNTGLFFLIGGTTTVTASDLAAAVVRNGASVGISATSSGSIVTFTATAAGAEGNLLNYTLTLSNFSLTSGNVGAGMGNIVAINNLYSTQGSVGGLCNQNGPSVYWSYFTGTGQALTSIVLSLDGTKVAYVENAAGGATLRILKWKAGEGTGAGYPVAPTTTLSAGQSWAVNCPAGNSCISSIAYNGGFQDTGSAPFYNYANDTLYVGDDSSRVHKFTGIFKGTPAEVTTNWPIQVNGTAKLTGPVFDSVSGNIFVGDNTGRLSFIREIGSAVGTCGLGSPPCLGSATLQVGTAGAIVDAPIVDGTTGRVFAVNGTDTTNNGTILQASTALTGAVSFKIGGTTSPGSRVYSGAFDNTYLTSAIPNIAGHMYVCGKETAQGDRPGLYQLSFAAATGILTGVGTPLTALTTANGEACSPVTEIDNPNGGGTGIEKNWILFSVGNSANSANPIPAGSGCRTNNQGCVISVDVTGNPTWPPTTVASAVTVPTNAAGGTSGTIVDNVSTSAQASSIYFSLGANSTGTGPGLPSCITTAGVGCAVKLTQSGLN
jgi:hypothetical protein